MFALEKNYMGTLPYLQKARIQQENQLSGAVNQKSEVEQKKEEKLTEDAKKAKEKKHTISLSAVSGVLMDASNNRVLYEKDGYKELAMASTTKIMTCLIALENGSLEDKVTVSKRAASMPDVQLNIKVGEQYKLGDLLYSLMLESHNDSAVAIAEHIGGSVEGFASIMNQKAKELGCEHTQFVTPNGLDAQGHYTTAYELAKIASYAIQNEKFLEVTNTPSWEFKELTKGKAHVVSNKNRFLYMMDGAIGVKTGFTNHAGYCFVGAVNRDGKKFVSVVLGSGWPPHKTYKWKDTTQLMKYGLSNYHQTQIFDSEVVLPKVFVEKGKKESVSLEITGDIQLLIRKDEAVRIKYDIPEDVIAPIKKHDVIGKALYYIEDALYQEVPIYATEAVDNIDFLFCVHKILEELM